MSKKKNVLVLSSIFPVSAITAKKDENDIILKTNMLLERNPSDSELNFLHAFIFPKSNCILSNFSKKWKEYYKLGKFDTWNTKYNQSLLLFPILFFPKNKIINKLLFNISFFCNRAKYKKVITLNNIKYLHAHSVSSDGYLAYKLSKEFNLPFVISVRELGRSIYDVEKILEKANKIVCINKIDEKSISDRFSDKSQFISHGLDQCFFNGSKTEFCKESIVRIVSICRLIPLKNIDKVIEVLANVKFEFTYDIYGQGGELENLKKLIRKYNLETKVRIKAPISYDKVCEVYPRYDIFVMPSSPEALGRVFIEAMASGLVIIGAQKTGIDGIIRDGENGFLINHDDIYKELPDKLSFILNNKEKLNCISYKAFESSLEFRWEDIIRKLTKIYE